MSENKDKKDLSYQDIVDLGKKTKEKAQKKSITSLNAKKNNNVNTRKENSGDIGHSTRKKNSSVKVDRSRIRETTLLHEFMEWKSMGLNDEICCNYIGINKQTLVNWKKKAVDAIEFCEDNDLHYDDHEHYDYIRFKNMYEGTMKAIVKNGMEAYKLLSKDIVVYVSDDNGEAVTDENGDKIVSKIARPGNVAAIDRMMKIADPLHFDNKQTIDINETKEKRVVMITHTNRIPLDENGNIIKEELEDMRQSFLGELQTQQEGLGVLIDSRSQQDNEEDNKNE